MSVSEKIVVNFTQGVDYLQKVGKLAEQAEEAKNTAIVNANIAKSNAQTATNAADSASDSATEARQDANNAQAQAEMAETSKQEAAQYAENARNSASDANMYAEMAFGAAAPAWSSSETYNYPQCVAYTDGKTYRCIGTNVTGSDVPGSSSEWVSIILDANKLWELDVNGNIMPI
jgi:hypothetical protein